MKQKPIEKVLAEADSYILVTLDESGGLWFYHRVACSEIELMALCGGMERLKLQLMSSLDPDYVSTEEYGRGGGH